MKLLNEIIPLGCFGNHTHKLSLGDHLCKFYKNDESLLDTFCNFIVPGLTRGDGVIIIATSSHLKIFQEALENRSIDFSKVVANGQMVILDAEQTLDKFMEDGLPNPLLFKNSVHKVMNETQKRFPLIRAYGEMVDVLWKKKNIEGAIQLEMLWNEAFLDFNFTLLCSYSEDSFHQNASASKLREVCSNHSHLIFSEGELFSANS